MVWDLSGLHKNNGAADYSFNNNWQIGLCRGTGKANGQIEYKNNVGNDFSQISNITYDYVVRVIMAYRIHLQIVYLMPLVCKGRAGII